MKQSILDAVSNDNSLGCVHLATDKKKSCENIIADARDLLYRISSTVSFINSGACLELEEVQDELLLHVQGKLAQLETQLASLSSLDS